MARFTSACDSLVISIKFIWHKKVLMERKYITGSIPLPTPNTFEDTWWSRRLSPLPQCLRNVAEKLARDGTKATSQKPIRSEFPTPVKHCCWNKIYLLRNCLTTELRGLSQHCSDLILSRLAEYYLIQNTGLFYIESNFTIAACYSV